MYLILHQLSCRLNVRVRFIHTLFNREMTIERGSTTSLTIEVDVFLSTTLSLTVLSHMSETQNAESKRPSIVMIMADDPGFGGISPSPYKGLCKRNLTTRTSWIRCAVPSWSRANILLFYRILFSDRTPDLYGYSCKSI